MRPQLAAGALSLLLLGLAGSALRAQAADSALAAATDMRGRHAVSIYMGLLPNMRANEAGASVSGVLGGLSYAYWPADSWNLEVGFGLHSAEATTTHAASVGSFLVGSSWYPLALGGMVRPYLGGAVGAYIGSETDAWDPEASVRSVAGGRVAAGADLFPVRHLRLGLRFAYHLAPDFARPVGNLRNASGSELAAQAGVVFGGKR